MPVCSGNAFYSRVRATAVLVCCPHLGPGAAWLRPPRVTLTYDGCLVGLVLPDLRRALGPAVWSQQVPVEKGAYKATSCALDSVLAVPTPLIIIHFFSFSVWSMSRGPSWGLWSASHVVLGGRPAPVWTVYRFKLIPRDPNQSLSQQLRTGSQLEISVK